MDLIADKFYCYLRYRLHKFRLDDFCLADADQGFFHGLSGFFALTDRHAEIGEYIGVEQGLQGFGVTPGICAKNVLKCYARTRDKFVRIKIPVPGCYSAQALKQRRNLFFGL